MAARTHTSPVLDAGRPVGRKFALRAEYREFEWMEIGVSVDTRGRLADQCPQDGLRPAS